jgi:predicted acyl esterase
MAVLKYGEKAPLENIVEDDFPIPRTVYKKAYLTPNGDLTFDKVPESGSMSYNSEDPKDIAKFTYTFNERTQLVGIPKAVLYMHCDDLDDMDIFLNLSKISASGEQLLSLNIPWENLPVSKVSEIPADKRTEVILYQGPTGILRASNRDIDTSRSMHPNWPYYSHEKEEKVQPGSVVRLEIGIWGMGVEYEAGESLQLRIGGFYQGISNFGTTENIHNKGNHWIHMGGEYDSHLILPYV